MDHLNREASEGSPVVEGDVGAITADIVKLLTQIEALLKEHRRSSASGPEVVRCLKRSIQSVLCEFGFRDVHPVIRYRRQPDDGYALCVRFLAYRDSFFWANLKVEAE